ncbi:MAG: sigma-70 family RNA polymerase sigma factor [Spirochaetia bacterium]|nr:sigma-70 family RNA polymerase sigma factor [Spirochaetia bacterium]
MTETEFASLIGRTKGVVLGAVRKHLYARHAHSIDDVVQETYLRAFRKLASFEERSQLTTWLYTIARNESFRMNQRLARREDRERAEVRDHLEIASPVPENDAADVGEEIRAQLRHLPEKIRQVMEKTVDGFSERETAESLRIPVGTVKSRASKGRELLSRLVLEKKKGENP